MIRNAFVISVHAGHESEYERRHRPIWHELEAALIDHGVTSCPIFLHPGTRQLFAYVEFANEGQWNAIAHTGVGQRWWQHLADLMPANGDNTPVAVELCDVFHLERAP